MKKIKLLPNVSLPEFSIGNVTLREGRELSMKQYLNHKISGFERFGGGKGNVEGPAQGFRISQAFNNANGYFKLEDADYDILRRCVEEVGLQPIVGMYGEVFKQAVLNAETVEMQEKKGKKDG